VTGRAAVDMATQVGAAEAEAVARMALGACLIASPGTSDEDGVREMLRSVEMLATGSPRLYARATNNTATFLRSIDRFTESLAVVTTSAGRLTRLGYADVNEFAASKARALLRLGRVDEVGELLDSIEPVRGLFDAFRLEAIIELHTLRADLDQAYETWRKLCEHPITFVDRRSGTSKMSKKIVYEAVFMVWRLKLRRLLGRL